MELLTDTSMLRLKQLVRAITHKQKGFEQKIVTKLRTGCLEQTVY